LRYRHELLVPRTYSFSVHLESVNVNVYLSQPASHLGCRPL
jgi:hypothetical protein